MDWQALHGFMAHTSAWPSPGNWREWPVTSGPTIPVLETIKKWEALGLVQYGETGHAQGYRRWVRRLV